MTTFVLVHGAFRGGWSWSKVRRELHRRGHEVFAPSLTGMGDRAHVRPEWLGLDVWAHDVAALVEAEDLRDVVLCGHSQGGIVVEAASQLVWPRLARLVFLDAGVPRPGERAVDLLPPPPGVALPPADAWLDPRELDEASGLPAADRAWANARLCATPMGPSLDPLLVDAPGALAVPRRYAFCSRTPGGYPSVATRARLAAEGVPFEVFDAVHDVPLADPELVVRLLLG